MEISEIMQFDWIAYKNINHKILKIIDDNVVLDSPVGLNDENIIANIKDCQPIDIKKEFLVECGFLEAKEKFLLDQGEQMLLLTYSEDTKDYNLSVGLCNMNVSIKYIHTLQHLLKDHGYGNIVIDLNRNNCEYSVGDWVSYGNANYQITDIHASDLRGDYILERKELYLSIVKKYGEFEPIKMCTDIVTVNKFNVDKDNTCLYTRKDEKFDISYEVNGMWSIINKETNAEYKGYIQYFHQLQNICKSLNIDVDLKPQLSEADYDELIDEVSK